MLAKLKSRGVLYLAGIAFNRVVPEFLFRARVFCVFRFDQPGAMESVSSFDDGIRFQWCESESQLEVARQMTFFRASESTNQACSHRACLAFEGDEPVGGVWIASGSFDESELGLQIELQPHQRWLFAANIAKSYRRRGIYGRMLKYVLSSVGKNGERGEILASINPTNKASMAAHRAMIDETLGMCVAVRFLSLAICCCRGKLNTTRAIGFGEASLVEVGA